MVVADDVGVVVVVGVLVAVLVTVDVTVLVADVVAVVVGENVAVVVRVEVAVVVPVDVGVVTSQFWNSPARKLSVMAFSVAAAAPQSEASTMYLEMAHCRVSSSASVPRYSRRA